MYKLIKNLVKKNIIAIIGIFLLQLFSAVISMFSPYLNGLFIDYLISASAINQITNFIIFILVINLFNIFMTYIYKMIMLKTKSLMIFDFNINVLKHLEKIPLELFEEFNPTYLNQRVKGDCESVIDFWIENIFTLVLNSFSIIFMLGLLFRVNFTLFIIGIIFIPIYCFIYLIMKNPLYRRNLETIENSNKYFGDINEVYIRNREIKTEVAFESTTKELNIGFSKYFKSLLSYSKLVFNFSASDQIISLLFQMVVFFIGGTQVISKKMTVGQFSMMNVYFSMILNLTKYYFGLGQSYQTVKVSIGRINNLLHLDIEKNGHLKISSIKSIQLKDFNYYYNLNNNVCKNNINIEINNPGIYAIIGKNGAGKTTLTNSIIGINNLNLEGDILFNNISHSEIDMYHLRKNNISVMIQGEKLPSISTKKYILNRIPEDLFNEKMKESKHSNLFVSNLFNIYDVLEKKIQNLSSGEKQMVLLLTTLFKNSDIYILDEPTSNVHAKLVESILNYLMNFKKNNKILIIITHDKEITKIFDSILNLEQI